MYYGPAQQKVYHSSHTCFCTALAMVCVLCSHTVECAQPHVFLVTAAGDDTRLPPGAWNARCCIGKKQGTTLVVCSQCPSVYRALRNVPRLMPLSSILLFGFFFQFQFDLSALITRTRALPQNSNLLHDSLCLANYCAFLMCASHGVVFMLHTVTLLSRASVPMSVCPSFY